MIDPEYDYPEPELFELVGVYSALGTFSVEQHTRLTD